MKNIVLLMGLLIAYNSFADIEYEGTTSKPTASEISKNRACFEELKIQGCGDPGEDPEQFRDCMNNVYSSLSAECKTLMTKLYR
jgi:hypothetical protein